MSDTPAGGLDLRAELARIDLERAETNKFGAETRKLLAERSKLDAESRKLNRDPWIIMAAAIIGAAGIIASRLPEILTAWRG
jgi:hypothetical protein